VSKANWCYLWFFAEDDELSDFRAAVEIIRTTYEDNRFLPQAYIDALLRMKNTNPVYYTIYALG